jgi:nucleoid-associated protein YgaU
VQRSVLAGGAVVFAAVVLAAIFWTGGEDDVPAEKTVASETASDSLAEAAAPAAEPQAQEEAPEGEAAQAEAPETGAAQQVTIQEVVRATEEGAEPVTEPAGGEAASASVEGSATSQSAAGSETEGQVAALPPDATPTFMAPKFDIVRVEPSGEAVIAGRSEPGSIVILLDGEEEIDRITTDETGAWVMIVKRPLAPGDHQLGLRAEMPDGSAQLSETLVIVSVPQPTLEVASGEAGAEQQAAAEPAPLAVEIQREGLSASRVLQQPEDAGLRDQALLLNAVDYDADGFVVVSGRAQPGARVVVYLDEEPLGTVVADANGHWQLAPDTPVASGLHRLRVDQVGDSGDVLARVATLFSRAELAGGFPEDRFVIVQPGNSLWRIARRTYGQGVRYSVIFQANNDQIVDPDLIFPGQIFLVPSTN